VDPTIDDHVPALQVTHKVASERPVDDDHVPALQFKQL